MLITGEHYHIYNRGAHKAPIFLDLSDYERFTSLLFAANDEARLKVRWHTPNLWQKTDRIILARIHAYCLMPNHFHLAVEQIADGQAEKFVHKLCTAYSMYYNRKYKHSGTIFQGNYKWKHVGDDDYWRYLIQYIHLNPFGIDEPELMKSAKTEYLAEAKAYARTYVHSSYRDYLGEVRPQGLIILR